MFFRQYDTAPGEWELAGVPDIHSTNFTVVDLKANTKYRFRMTLAVRSGNGPASPEVIASTKEGGMLIIYTSSVIHVFFL